MSNLVSWKKIVTLAAALFFSEALVGFINGGSVSGSDVDVAMQRWTISTLLSLLFSTLLFLAMAARQANQPFLHATLALLINFAFSLALGAILPAWLTEMPKILVALQWFTLVVGLLIGTSLGCYVRARKIRADA